jgi:hypothetical protein
MSGDPESSAGPEIRFTRKEKEFDKGKQKFSKAAYTKIRRNDMNYK